MIDPYQRSVGTSATLLLNVPGGTSTVIITNAGTAPVYVGGGSTVTTSNGHPIPSNTTVSFVNYTGSSSATFYGISSAVSMPVGVTICTSG